jgi:aquaporin NIP
MSDFKSHKNFFLEIVVTFQMVFIGTGSIVVSEKYHTIIGDFEIGMCFGLAIYLGIMLFAKMSNAHMNPAATILLLSSGKIKNKIAVTLLLAQLIGALIASLLLSLIAPAGSGLGSTMPHVGIWNSWIIEFGLTSFLLIVLYSLNNAKISTVASVIGTVVFLEAWLAGPLTGASMNPFRSLAPAIVSGNLDSLWIYLTAPFAASGFVYLLNKNFKLNKVI